MGRHIDEYIETLKRLTGSRTDGDLATYLDRAKQTVSSWRRRGWVPTDVQYYLVDKFGPEAALGKEVLYAATSRERQAVLTTMLVLFDEWRSSAEPKEDSHRYLDWSQAFLNCEDEILETVRRLGFTSPGHNQFSVAQMVVALVKVGELETVQRSLDVWIPKTHTTPDESP